MVWYGGNDTILRRSAQLLLAPENDHFEVCMLLKAKEGTNARLDGVGQGIGEGVSLYLPSPLCLEKHDTFKVIVLRRQEELCGPSQHSIIRTILSHNSPMIFRRFREL